MTLATSIHNDSSSYQTKCKSNHHITDSQCLLKNHRHRSRIRPSPPPADRMIRCTLIIILAILLLLIAVSGLFMLLISSVPNDFTFPINIDNNDDHSTNDESIESSNSSSGFYYSLTIFQLSLIITEVIIALSIIFIIEIHNEHTKMNGTAAKKCSIRKRRTTRCISRNRNTDDDDDKRVIKCDKCSKSLMDHRYDDDDDDDRIDIIVEHYGNGNNNNNNNNITTMMIKKQFHLIFILKIIFIIMITLSILLRLYTTNIWRWSWICHNCYDQKINFPSSSTQNILYIEN